MSDGPEVYTMAYWCGVAFGVGAALFFVGLGTIPVGEGTLPVLKWAGAVVGLAGCIGAYVARGRMSAAAANG